MKKMPVMTTVNNPLFWADVPDPDVIRVGIHYYMVSTSMHLMPGVPIMRSFDLAHWEIVSYVYDTLEDNDAYTLRNKKNAYGAGSWASSLRFHNGVFYVCFASNDMRRTYIYRTNDIIKGPWDRSILTGVYHDPSLLFDDDGRVYIVYGAGTIRIKELTPDATAFLPGGADTIIIRTSQEGNRVNVEGSHAYNLNGMYYVFLIQWPSSGHGRRIQWCYRSADLFGGYEGKIVMDDDLGYRNQGVAQGGVFDTPDGDWYAMLFQDHGAVGRIPVLLPVSWRNGWPEIGVGGKAPHSLAVPLPTAQTAPLVTTDEFNQDKNALLLQWQWNHNPDNSNWSLSKRPGYLRLTTGHTVKDILSARNTLTQRTEGPACSGEILLSTGGMQPGDYAGLAAFQSGYGLIGVHAEDNGLKSIFMAVKKPVGGLQIRDSVALNQDDVCLKIDFSFTDGRDEATFFYSPAGGQWKQLGGVLAMRYTLDHFTGYRLALFNYATRTAGGYADFDYFRYTRGQEA